MNEVISSRLKKLIVDCKTGNDIFILKGFGPECYEELQNIYKPLFSVIKQDEKINLTNLISEKRSLMRKVVNSESGVFIGLYEELLLIEGSFTDLSDSNLVVIENNYYDGFYPTAFDDSTIQQIHKMKFNIEHESLEVDEEKDLADFISDIRLIDNEVFISYLDLQDKVCPTYFKVLDPQGVNIRVVELEGEPIISDYYVENSEDLLRFKRHLEIGRLKDNEINLLVESSTGSRTKIIDALRCIMPVYPKLNINLFYQNRVAKTTVRKDFTRILYKYWKTELFREIDFYENPDMNTNKVSISQGVIIQTIVEQVEKARDNQRYQDVFVTAPTGAGKSILYQIPAIYLAQKHQLLTIVISPLKALMLDQVRQLKEKGVDFVEYINSDLSQLQKQDILSSIQQGQTSILYASPELLLAYDIRTLIGDTREIGLIIVDEAHLVTTWGRDFRIDYWYLGGYIKRLRDYRGNNGSAPFVVASFTATAVYRGNDDMVFETIASLNMNNPIKFLGNTRRENISFRISNWEKRSSYEEERMRITALRIVELIKNGKKALVYAPYRRHIDDIEALLDKEDATKVVKYHAGLDSDYKNYFEEQFRTGKASVMLATKAFGMGVDISDIEMVYHHAPTGNLCDYVQEIGRAARDPHIHGYAMQDFNEKSDLRYARVLYGLSGMKQYQLREVLAKLYRLYLQEGRRNFLVNPASFQYLFTDEENFESKLKNALLLIEKDLHAKYAYPVIIVRPKSLFSRAYAAISNEILNDFLESEYAPYITKLADEIENTRISGLKDRNYTILDIGPIYEINLRKLWEDKFTHMSFPMLKKAFYEKKLFINKFAEHVHPRFRLSMKFSSHDPEKINETFDKHVNCITEFFSGPGRSVFFKKEDVRQFLKSRGYTEVDRRKIVNALIDLFVIKQGDENRDAFLQKRNTQNQESGNPEDHEEYRVTSVIYHRTFTEVKNRLKQLLTYINSTGEISRYFAIKKNDPHMNLAYILEAFSMASYDIKGGHAPEIFIRINDPYRVSTLTMQHNSYSNAILKDIKDRQERSFSILKYFFTRLENDEARWDFIEDYFLGNTMLE
ncbi:MAG: helicase-related protein [Syntrophomonas sp.]